MPGIITHYLCAEAALCGLPPSAREIIKRYKGLYRVGAQGPDIFFYYVPGFLGGGFPKIGSSMHNSGVSALMSCVADEISAIPEERGEDKYRLLSYFAGYITHYCLDYTAHPYIYYKTGFSKRGELTIKSSALHRRFETDVDVAMLNARRGAKPRDKHLWRLFSVKRRDTAALSAAIAGMIRRVYSVAITAGQVRRSIAVARFCTRALQSGKGRRARFLAALEGIAGCKGVVSGLVHPQVPRGKDPLNLGEKEWLLPYDNKKRNNASFPQLFEAAAKSAVDMIAALFAYAGEIGGKSVTKGELLSIIGDNSLKTGTDAGSGAVFKYSERNKNLWRSRY